MTDHCQLRPEDWVHVTSNSGLRLRITDSRLHEIGPMAEPVIVTESSEGFRSLWSTDALRLVPEANGVTVQGIDLQIGELSRSLETALNSYRLVHPLPEKVAGRRPRRFARAVTLDLWLPEGRIAHTYADAVDLMNALAEQGLSENTLLYLPGWNAPYDTRYPEYNPADQLGGEDGFSCLVDTSRKLGVTVMPHLNFWAYDTASGLCPDYEDFQLRDESGEPEGWPGILRSGFTNALAFMRVDDERWSELFFRFVDPLIRDYELEAVFLDQIGSAPISAIKHASIKMLKRLHSTFPHLVVGGEILAEWVLPYLDVMQAWGMPWCGVMIDFTDSLSPIVRLLYETEVDFVAHLGIPCATPARYCWTNYPYIVEHGYRTAFEACQQHQHLIGGIPQVRIAFKTHGLDALSIRALRGERAY